MEAAHRAFCKAKAAWAARQQRFSWNFKKRKISLDFFAAFFINGKKQRKY